MKIKESVIDHLVRNSKDNKRIVLRELAEDYDISEEMVEAIVWDFMSTERGVKIMEEEIESIFK